MKSTDPKTDSLSMHSGSQRYVGEVRELTSEECELRQRLVAFGASGCWRGLLEIVPRVDAWIQKSPLSDRLDVLAVLVADSSIPAQAFYPFIICERRWRMVRRATRAYLERPPDGELSERMNLLMDHLEDGEGAPVQQRGALLAALLPFAKSSDMPRIQTIWPSLADTEREDIAAGLPAFHDRPTLALLLWARRADPSLQIREKIRGLLDELANSPEWIDQESSLPDASASSKE